MIVFIPVVLIFIIYLCILYKTWYWIPVGIVYFAITLYIFFKYNPDEMKEEDIHVEEFQDY